MRITRLAELPLPQREPYELLALQIERLAPDGEHAGFGWAWVEDLELAAPARPSVCLPRALIVALHSADEQVDEGDIELELDLGQEVVRAPLSRVLQAKLADLPPADDVVLVLCNPGHVAVSRPAGFSGARLYFASGDVTSWLDRDVDGEEHIRLSARAWKVAA